MERLGQSVWCLWEKGCGSRLGGRREGSPGVLCSLQSCLCSLHLSCSQLWPGGLSLPQDVAVGAVPCSGAAEPHSQCEPPGVPQGLLQALLST